MCCNSNYLYGNKCITTNFGPHSGGLCNDRNQCFDGNCNESGQCCVGNICTAIPSIQNPLGTWYCGSNNPCKYSNQECFSGSCILSGLS
jgi:hypothetical protein